MNIFGLNIWKYSYQELLREFTEILHDASLSWGKAIFTPNPEICLRTLQDAEFLQVLQSADYLTSDGIGLYLGYQIQDSRLPKLFRTLMLPYYIFNILFRKRYLYSQYWERICGSDLTTSLVEYAQHQEMKIAIIDPYYPKDLQKCASQQVFREKLLEKFPRLLFDFYIYSDENKQEVFQKIASSDAKILFSTLGMKKQEISILEWLEKCPNVRLWLGIGSSFDYFIGFQKRAPKIFRSFGFEWLYRIFTSPKKIQRLGRIFQALVVFPIKIIFYKK